MERNVVKEWSKALLRVTPSQERAWAQVFAKPPRDFMVFEPRVTEQEGRNLLRATRALPQIATFQVPQNDLARAILILRRNNRLLRARFGVDWAAATCVLMGEAHRRGMSVASLARVLAAGLRRDARGAGESGAL